MFVKELLASTDVMENTSDGTITTLDDFLNDFCPKFEIDHETIRSRFLEFYQTQFNVIQPLISQMEGAKPLLEGIKQHLPDVKVILATNPVFPFIAVQKRMEWGGISEDYFDLITHAENSNYCKNNKNYWLEITDKFDIKPEEALVIGNDVFRDLVAKKHGFKTYLVENAVENEEALTEETKPDFRGTLEDLYQYLILQ